MIVPSRSWALVILLVVLPGCSRTLAPPIGTVAREAVQDYYEGLVRQDWHQAYVALHPDSKNRLTQPEFTRLAEAYRRNLGFDPEQILVQSCEEKGMEAIAHVVLTGHTASRQLRYKDAVVLRQSANRWGIILSDTFGGNTR
jgi:hypothetical protein